MWIKKIKKRKIQMLLIGIIALISSFMLAASIGIIINISEPMNKLIEDTKPPVIYYTANKDADWDKEINQVKKDFLKDKRVSEVKVIDNVIQSNAKIKGNGKYFDLSYQYFLPYKPQVFGKSKFLQGGGKLNYGECFISSGISETYKISINDSIIVENPGGNIKLKVKGIYANPYSVNISMGGFMFYLNDKQCKEMSGFKKELITVYSNSNESPNDMESNYEKNSNKQVFNNILNLDLAKMSAEMGGQILGGIIACFAAIILVVSAIVIKASIFDSIIKEYKTIGVYKALGYSSRTIINIYFKAYSAVIIASAIVGSFFSKFLIGYILRNSFKAYGSAVNGNYIVPAIVTIIIVALIMLSSVYSVIRKTKNIPPVEALTLGSPVNSKKGKSFSFMENNFSPLFQGMRKIFCYKKFTLILLIVLFICSYIVTFSITLYNNFLGLESNSTFWFGLDDANYKIAITGKEKESDILNWMKNNNHVKNFVKGTISYWPAVVDRNDMKNKDGGLLLNVYSKFDGNGIKEKVLEGRNPKYDNEVAVTKKLLGSTDKSIGDYIDIYINGRKKSLLITGTYQSMLKSGMNARVKESTVMSVDKNYVSSNIYFNLKSDNDFKTFKNQIKKQFGNSIDVFPSNDFYKDMLEEVIGQQINGMVPFIGIVIAIGAVNVFSIITLMNLNSRKEFCIYKSLGYNTFDLIVTNMYYVMILGIAAVILCIPVFKMSISKIVNGIFGGLGIYDLPIDVKPAWLLIGLSVSIAIYMISTWISSFSIRKFEVNELNEE